MIDGSAQALANLLTRQAQVRDSLEGNEMQHWHTRARGRANIVHTLQFALSGTMAEQIQIRTQAANQIMRPLSPSQVDQSRDLAIC